MADRGEADAAALTAVSERLATAPSDRDRLRVLGNFVDNFTVTCAEALGPLVRAMHDSPAVVKAGTLAHGMVRDQDAFESVLLAGLKWEDDRKDIRAALGL